MTDLNHIQLLECARKKLIEAGGDQSHREDGFGILDEIEPGVFKGSVCAIGAINHCVTGDVGDTFTILDDKCEIRHLPSTEGEKAVYLLYKALPDGFTNKANPTIELMSYCVQDFNDGSPSKCLVVNLFDKAISYAKNSNSRA